MPKVYKSQLIEVVSIGVASSGNQTTKIQFPDQPYLRNKAITSIEIVTQGEMSESPSGRTPLTIAQMQKCYLTLYLTDAQNPNNVGEWIQLTPFTLLHRAQNSGSSTTSMPFVRQMYDLQSQVVYWEKCYISISSALGNTADVSFLFNVYFKN
jgi:hypothetical protein